MLPAELRRFFFRCADRDLTAAGSPPAARRNPRASYNGGRPSVKGLTWDVSEGGNAHGHNGRGPGGKKAKSAPLDTIPQGGDRPPPRVRKAPNKPDRSTEAQREMKLLSYGPRR